MQRPGSYQLTRPRHPYPLPMNGGAYELSLFRYFNLAATPAYPGLHYRSGNFETSEANQSFAFPRGRCMFKGWQMAIDGKLR